MAVTKRERGLPRVESRLSRTRRPLRVSRRLVKNSLSALAPLLSLVTTATPAPADDAQLRTTLQSRYAALKVAMGAHDDKGVEALLAPGFVSTDVSGQAENAGQMLKEVDALASDPNKTSSTTLVSVSLDANIATVKQRYDMKTVKTAPDGSKRNIELVTLSTDKWLNRAA